MYVLLIYDIGVKRVGKMLKLCRGYLNWIQNSSFEGEISSVKLKELRYKAKKIMNESEDSIIIYQSQEQRWLNKEVIGVEKMPISEFL